MVSWIGHKVFNCFDVYTYTRVLILMIEIKIMKIWDEALRL